MYVCAVADSRFGLIQYLPRDGSTGESIRVYGEYLQRQIDVLAPHMKPGANVVYAGVGIGAHALALSQIIGPSGHLIVYESRPLHKRVLKKNLGQYGADNVTVMRGSLSSRDPAHVVTADWDTLDDLGLARLDLLKLDDAASAETILAGAEKALWQLRPMLCISAADDEALDRLAAEVARFGYRCRRMVTPLFNANNFACRTVDIFGGRSAFWLWAVAEESGLDLSGAGYVEL
jgi:precorrin-6B methylase 2